MASLVGSRVERKEDKKFLTGRGRYTADVNFSNQTYAYFFDLCSSMRRSNKICISLVNKIYISSISTSAR